MRLDQSNVTRPLIPSFTKLSIIVLLSLLLLILQGCQKDNDDPPATKAVDMQLIAEDFVSPIQVVATHNSDRLYVVDQIGKIWVIDGSGFQRPTPFLDLSSKIVPLNPDYDERGLLGVAFHEDFKTNGTFVVYYQMPPLAGGPVPGASWNN